MITWRGVKRRESHFHPGWRCLLHNTFGYETCLTLSGAAAMCATAHYMI